MTALRTSKKEAESEENNSAGLSRRDFIAATAATGIAMGVGDLRGLPRMLYQHHPGLKTRCQRASLKYFRAHPRALS